MVPETSFKGALLGEKRSEKVVVTIPERPSMDFFLEEELLEELECGFVGTLASHMEAEAVHTCLFMEAEAEDDVEELSVQEGSLDGLAKGTFSWVYGGFLGGRW